MTAADRLDQIEARAQAADRTALAIEYVPALVAAVRAVLDLHRLCEEWPCPTVQAITGALGGERS